LILTVFFTFSYVGCVQEEVGPQASLDEDVVLAKKGDVDDFYKDGTSSDCHCKMRILSVTGYDDMLWLLWQNDLVGDFSFVGMGNTWWLDGSGYLPVPSEFRDLSYPGSECYHFVAHLSSGAVSNDVVISTEVRCYENGAINPTTVTYHQLVVPAEVETAHFWRRFLCRYLTNEESADCSPSSGGSN